MRWVSNIPPVKPDDWYERRGYCHFDRPVSASKAKEYVQAFPAHPDPKGDRGYRFWPFIKRDDETPRYKEQDDGTRRIETKVRPICFASHLDSHVYKYTAEKLNASYEGFLYGKDFSHSVLAYRSFKKIGGPIAVPDYNIHLPRFDGESKSNIHFARDAFCAVKSLAPCVALALDIKGFFDHLDHKLLKYAWMDVEGRSLTDAEYQVYKQITEHSYIEEKWLEELFPDHYSTPFDERGPYNRICTPEEFRTKVLPSKHVETNRKPYGIPQGSPISALLSNIYMYKFDKKVHDRIVKDLRGVYLRYSDDILLIVPPMRERAAERFVMKCIRELKLKIQPKKTERCVFSRQGKNGDLQCWNLDGEQDRLQYLGFTFDGQQLLIRDPSITRYDRRANASVRRAGIGARETPVENKNNDLIRRKRLYENYTHFGNQNFISYAYRADDVMTRCSQLRPHSCIRGQVSDHVENLEKKIVAEEKKIIEEKAERS